MKNAIWRVFSEADKVPRIPRKSSQKLSDYPTYTVSEAALSLGMAPRTLYRWVLEDPLWKAAGAKASGAALLSFNDVAQFYFIEFIRKHSGISFRTARDILRNSRLESRSRYPLLGKNIKTLFGHVVMDKNARVRNKRYVVDLSQHRQTVMTQVVDMFSTRIERDADGNLEIFPWRCYTRNDANRPVNMNPQIMSGRLVITGTRIPVRVVWERKLSGETEPQLADDYGISEQIISDALRHLVPVRKAA